MAKLLTEIVHHNFYYVEIPPGTGNKYIKDLYIDLPFGTVPFGNVNFKLDSKSLVFDTGSHIRYYFPRSDGSKEVKLKLPKPVQGVKTVYFLLNSGNSKSIYKSEKIGEIVLHFQSGLQLTTELILGKNIREWRLGTSGDFVRNHTDPDSTTVWKGFSIDGKNAVIDCLKITVPTSLKADALKEIYFTHQKIQKNGDTLGPQFFISGITLELDENGENKRNLESSKITKTSKDNARDIKSQQTSSDKSNFEVVLSFAGENREYVEKVAAFLKAHNVKVFYDKDEKVNSWGKNLVEYFDEIFKGNAKFCIMFISKFYEDKMWTRYERQIAISKAIREKKEYILPVRFDETEIPGISPTIAYIDALEYEPEKLGQLILEKLKLQL